MIQMNLKLVKPQMILLHPHKIMIKIKRMNITMNKNNLEMKMKIMINRRAMIEGLIRMMGIIKDQGKNDHTQECVKPFKEITIWTTFLVISKRG
jgi:hypothetical protein